MLSRDCDEPLVQPEPEPLPEPELTEELPAGTYLHFYLDGSDIMIECEYDNLMSLADMLSQILSGTMNEAILEHIYNGVAANQGEETATEVLFLIQSYCKTMKAASSANSDDPVVSPLDVFARSAQ